MYIFVTAYVKVKGRNGRWLEQDVRQTPLKDLYENNSRIWLILTHETFDDALEDGEEPLKVSLDMELLKTSLGYKEATVAHWLQQNGNLTLPTVPGVVALDNQTVAYSDAFAAGYDIATVKPGAHPDAYFPNSERTDLLLTKEDLDYAELYRHALVTVNGIVHQTSYSEYGLHVTDGAHSGSIANENHVGIISFLDVGSLEFIPIRSDMVHPHSEGRPLREDAYISLDKDLTDKTVLLVLGGYLHVLDSTYRQVSDSVFKIDFRNYPLPQKLFELMNFIDLKSLDLTEYAKNEKLIEVEELYSDASILAYLGLSQSFFVVVDTDELYVEKRQLEKTKLPGRWYSHIKPNLPLLKGNGKLEDYVWCEEQGVYVVRTVSNYQIRHYNFETTQWKEDPGIDNTKPTVQPLEWARGYLLEIGRDL